MSKYLQIAVSAALISASSLTFAQDPVSGQAAYAVPDGYSAKVVEDIFKQGGNAVDAAVATAFTLAVTYPEAGNIGGGGFMTIFFDGKPYFLDYRETAPAAATRDMYLDEKGEVIENLSMVGARAAGVPGTVMGLWEAHQRFGEGIGYFPFQAHARAEAQLLDVGIAAGFDGGRGGALLFRAHLPAAPRHAQHAGLLRPPAPHGGPARVRSHRSR